MEHVMDGDGGAEAVVNYHRHHLPNQIHESDATVVISLLGDKGHCLPFVFLHQMTLSECRLYEIHYLLPVKQVQRICLYHLYHCIHCHPHLHIRPRLRLRLHSSGFLQPMPEVLRSHPVGAPEAVGLQPSDLPLNYPLVWYQFFNSEE